VLLSTKTLQDIQDIQGKNQLKDEILASINKIIPPGKIAKIYFTDFVVQ
jgi:flagellar FliL protein